MNVIYCCSEYNICLRDNQGEKTGKIFKVKKDYGKKEILL
jgi:hypothetical protein